MPEPMTEREAALTARVAELERMVAGRAGARAGGSVIEQIWHYVTYLVPLSIIAAGIAVFVGFHAWEAYNHGLKAAADTRLKAAQAALKESEAAANKLMVNGKPLRVEMMRAEVTKKQQEAEKAKADAQALNTLIDGVAAETQRVQLEVQNKELAAQQAQLEASALTQTDDKLRTIADKLAAGQAKLTDLQALDNRVKSVVPQSISTGREIEDLMAPIIAEACRGPYARDLGCRR